jgi:hypothetical protein
MRNVPIPIPEDTLSRLRDLAMEQRRSVKAQALVLIEQALKMHANDRDPATGRYRPR